MKRGLLIILLILGSLVCSLTIANPLEYENFNEEILNNYGAEYEPLMYDYFGAELEFIEDDEWSFASENSIALGFETNLPAKSYVEYGSTASYGQKTETTVVIVQVITRIVRLTHRG